MGSVLVLFCSVFPGGAGLHLSLGPPSRAHLARAGVLLLGSQQCRRLGCRDVALGPWLETEAPARGGAASGPAVSGPGRPAGKGESDALQARALCLGLSTVVPVIVFL